MVRVYNDGMSNLVDTLIVKIIKVCESHKMENNDGGIFRI